MNEQDLKSLQEINAKKNHLLSVGGSAGESRDLINLYNNFTISEDDLQAENEESIKWETPKPLEKEYILPSFPLDCLPADIKEYVEAVAENTATPVDMAAVASLAVVAGSVQKKFKIKGKPDYYEPLNIYSLIIADPGERKSSVMREMTRYTKDYERQVNELNAEMMDEQRSQYNILTNELAKSEKSGDIDQAISFKKELRELEKEMIRSLRLVADDVTPEALTSLLNENNGALSVISAEGGFFDILAGRYSNTACIDIVLKAHSGDDAHVDRKGRPKEYIRNPALTILLSVQNDVIRGIFENGTFKGRGLNARFLYSKPVTTIGTRSFETKPISIELKINYKTLIYELLDIPTPVATAESENINIIKIDDGAYSILKDYFDSIEKRLIGDLEDMRDWAGKLVGAALRIAGILHCMNFGKMASEVLVNQKTMMNAIVIADYFLEHSRACYQLMGIDEDAERAKHVLKKLELKPQEEYKKYDIFRICKNTYIKGVDDLEPMLMALVEYGYLFEIIPKPTRAIGRKPAPIYKLNPLHFKI